ncbi:MAG: FMN-binding negative transcriptional regulator [Bdellovibrionaceae bacterium]|nr:FMN-binding negative transcriptional regulator [Pseudobdellovibrionaceae bacterium]
MYRPKVFAEDRIEVLHQFIRQYPLATVVTSGPEGLLANLIPVSLHEIGKKGTIRLHLAKMNSQAERIQAGDEILFVFNGPQAYVTPSFYPSKQVNGKVVPTWNYSTVQVRGKAKVFDDPNWVLQQINDLTSAMEKDRSVPWGVSDAPDDYILSQLKIIIGIEVVIEAIEGKFKVSQNQSAENNKGVIDGFIKEGNKEMASLVAERRRS